MYPIDGKLEKLGAALPRQFGLAQWRIQVANGAWAQSNTIIFLSLTEEDYDRDLNARC